MSTGDLGSDATGWLHPSALSDPMTETVTTNSFGCEDLAIGTITFTSDWCVTDQLYTIQTDTVVETTLELETSASETTRNLLPTRTYTGTCAMPLATDTIFWALYPENLGPYDPFNCGGRAFLLNGSTYCCKGVMIDITNALVNVLGESKNHTGDRCLENIRCCSDDTKAIEPRATTSCTIGTAASLVAEAPLSSSFYAALNATTTELGPSPSLTAVNSATASSSTSVPNASYRNSADLGAFAPLFLISSLAIRRLIA